MNGCLSILNNYYEYTTNDTIIAEYSDLNFMKKYFNIYIVLC